MHFRLMWKAEYVAKECLVHQLHQALLVSCVLANL